LGEPLEPGVENVAGELPSYWTAAELFLSPFPQTGHMRSTGGRRPALSARHFSFPSPAGLMLSTASGRQDSEPALRPVVAHVVIAFWESARPDPGGIQPLPGLRVRPEALASGRPRPGWTRRHRRATPAVCICTPRLASLRRRALLFGEEARVSSRGRSFRSRAGSRRALGWWYALPRPRGR
jgi:hypothetical protein